jgi:hypothetical protein
MLGLSVMLMVSGRWWASAEETLLASSEGFGDVYRSYAARTGRFFPRLGRRWTTAQIRRYLRHASRHAEDSRRSSAFEPGTTVRRSVSAVCREDTMGLSPVARDRRDRWLGW